MIATTLCYLECQGRYLMLRRDKKEHDLNEGKWIGVGGKMEAGESPLEGALREIREETGIVLEELVYRGLVKFYSEIDNEDMYLFTAELAEMPELQPCDEGTLSWVEKSEVLSLPTWEGDKYFLKPLLDNQFDVEMSLYYEGDKLVRIERKGEEPCVF